MTRRPRPKRKGTLHLIGAILVASASLRMGAGTGEALAESLINDGVASADVVSDSAVEKDALLRSLQQREAAVAAKELAIDDRMRALNLAESEIQEQLAALETAEESLRSTIALADVAAEADLTRLTAVYENMKPKDAAALFEEMSPEFSAGFLGMMRPEAAASIMTLLTPQTAYSISVILAGRNVDVPTE